MPQHVTVRTATNNDVEAMTWIGLAASPLNPLWHYRYPHSGVYPDDHIKFSRLRMQEYLNQQADGSRRVMIAEAPSLEDSNSFKAVAFAVWWMPGSHLRRDPQDTEEKTAFFIKQLARRDGDPARMAKFLQVVESSKARNFDSQYGEKQLYLYNIATHPDYQRQGAAMALLSRGQKLANSRSIPIGLHASELGKQMYLKAGFREIESLTVQVDGEEEMFVTPAMIWEQPSSWGEEW